MKKYIGLISLVFVMVFPLQTFANSYTNDLGVVITEEDYNNFRKIYSEKYISVLTQEEYDRLKSLNLDFNNVNKTEKYIKTEYNHTTGESEDTIITKEEFDSASAEPQSRATVIETSYKYTSLYLVKVSDSNRTAYMSYTALWKIMPAVRSFDVNGIRLSNMEVVNGTQQGKQVYTLNGTTDFVQYNFNGTNIKNLSNGFGISMNLLNSNVTYLESTIDSSLGILAYPAGLFASYQHAIEDVSLATSQNYTIGVGLGDVFVFNNGIGSKYDGMEGTYDFITS